ncbi:MAG: hypothetical protein JWN37_104 [Candidatus Nomurabacteria bacterium]|nr:hypothetical protein [Candidatus Nomurabacteria bacterium]
METLGDRFLAPTARENLFESIDYLHESIRNARECVYDIERSIDASLDEIRGKKPEAAQEKK